MPEMNETYANQEVLEFYKKLPFNYYGSINKAVENIKRRNAVEYYSVIPKFLKKTIKVIDVGCGTSAFVNTRNYYYGSYGTSAVGMDFNSVALNQARAVSLKLGIVSDFFEADIFRYCPDYSYDLVTSIGVLHHTNNCIEGLRRLCRYYVEEGGFVFIGLYHKYGRKAFLDYFKQLKLNSATEKDLIQEFLKLRPANTDETHFLSWFYDQVLHPHETQHSLAEIIPVLQSESMELVATSINEFKSFRDYNNLYEIEKTYSDIGRQRLLEGKYFPGFFVFLAQKRSGTKHKD